MRYPYSYSTILSFSHTASLGWSASLKLCLPHSLVSAIECAGALLQKAARPGDDGQGDSAPKLLEKAHQRCVGHPPRTLPVHLEQDVPTPYPAIVIGWRPLHDGADEKGLIAVDLLLTSHDAEAQAARSAPPQDNVFAAIKMPG